MARIEGKFLHLIFSPRGGIEGVLLEHDGRPVQLVFEKHDELSPLRFEPLRGGQDVVVEARPAGPSAKGDAEHPVFDHVRLISVDGLKPVRPKAAGAAYQGVVARLNYARHGAANGVVLDTGDFIHIRPDGMARLRLRVGDEVAADGDAQLLSTGAGWAVEATRVNGKKLSA